MADDENTRLLREIRDLLQIMAEPQVAVRDKRLREELLKIVGTSTQKGRAVLAMDGLKSQAIIRRESGMDDGNLSRLVKSLRSAGLLIPDAEEPKLAIPIQNDFFDKAAQKK